MENLNEVQEIIKVIELNIRSIRTNLIESIAALAPVETDLGMEVMTYDFKTRTPIMAIAVRQATVKITGRANTYVSLRNLSTDDLVFILTTIAK